MKKLIALAMAAIMALSMVACGGSSKCSDGLASRRLMDLLSFTAKTDKIRSILCIRF